VERLVLSYSALDGEPEQWPQEEKIIAVSNLAPGAKVRILIKELIRDGTGGTVLVTGGHAAIGFSGVSYSTSADQPKTAIGDSGEFVEWIAQSIS
jgi:hypothetical protein